MRSMIQKNGGRFALAFMLSLLLGGAVYAAPMSGAYTINPTGSGSTNFTSFNAAVSALASNGVTGPVTFTVSPATYTEQVIIYPISGASATNTITFDGVDASTRILTWDIGSTSYKYTYAVYLNGADYITFKNLTINGTGSTSAYTYAYSSVVLLTNSADYNQFLNCVITGPTGLYNYCSGITLGGGPQYYYTGNGGHNCLFQGNTVSAWFGICSNGIASYTSYPYPISDGHEGNQYIGNTVNAVNMGFYFQYVRQQTVRGNKINCLNAAYPYGYAIETYIGESLNIEQNTIVAGYMGLYLYYLNYYGGTRSRIVNNAVTSTGMYGYYGLYSYYLYNTDVLHNSIQAGSTTYPTYSAYGAMMGYWNNSKFINNSINIVSGTYSYRVALYGYYNTFNTGDFDYNNFYTGTSPNLSYYQFSLQNSLGALQGATGANANSISIDPGYVNPTTGDLHQNLSLKLVRKGTPVGVLVDIDGDPRSSVQPSIGCDEGCYVPEGGLSAALTDAAGNPVTYYTSPGDAYVTYMIAYPLAVQVNATITVKFYTVGANAQFAYQYSFPVTKPAGSSVNGTHNVPVTLNPGFYRVEIVVNTINSCGIYGDEIIPAMTMMLREGQVPCNVWPGDVNNDGIVNFPDRRDLNKYIHDANLNPTWLNGPGRYRLDAATNPMTYYTWEAQIGVPWATPEGCYMDADGNGVINNFDYLAIKLNFYRTHGTPKTSAPSSELSFDLSQNYPNPFNPSTVLQYSTPEASQVRIVVYDAMGREITQLVNATVDAGRYSVSFDASTLPSGDYLAVVNMTGTESGTSFSKTVKMTLMK